MRKLLIVLRMMNDRGVFSMVWFSHVYDANILAVLGAITVNNKQ